MSIVIVATIRPRPETRADVIAALERVIPRVHAEDAGCELYALHEAPDRLVMVEKWADQAALDAHSRSDAFRQLTADLDGKLADRLEVHTLDPHPAGTAQQGTL
ncbi:putative quinol monooxygenase [Streptomyces brasiliensis]|uniref:Antibiotic biosynthesis monooxygenase n=1 Tax=Streptomyces brasiliensis TaxID=1954 RepID=A0A917UMH8_9ACTN|nr:putative quinol monooxygenase [Streptomyces brasiliensis]GGJ68175.1 antibiotic biosynthesis monooxygenase [Streptomyces brasiliensis]